MRLLNRTTRSISATEAGKAYFERLRPLLDEYDHLDLADRVASQTLRGRLRLTEPLSFGVIEFAPALNDFALRYPEIKLDVIGIVKLSAIFATIAWAPDIKQPSARA